MAEQSKPTQLAIADAIHLLQMFRGPDLTKTIGQIEKSLKGAAADGYTAVLTTSGAKADILRAAGLVKQVAAQIDVVVHTLGILLCLPHILRPGEVIEYVSLGAGNTKRKFDLETNQRIAEFKFIRWQGGSESIRQNSLFKDFYGMAEQETKKEKFLYVLGTEHGEKFFNGSRALSSVLSRNDALKRKFTAKYDGRYDTVRDYYLPRKGSVVIQDVSPFVPELVATAAEAVEAKRNEPVPLTAGVLIIGSLLWDSKKGRPAWRAARLDMPSAQTVTAPIRYGRLSGSRGDSYTMVFSRACPPGHAKVVPCTHTISTVQDLIAEAECLWKAEQPGAEAHRIASTWGCVALLCNPDKEIPAYLLRGWAERVANESDYGNVSQTEEEGVLVSSDGLLRLNWPHVVEVGAAADMDLLLVTANDPEITATSPSYPTPAAIAQAWNRAGTYVDYFWKNTDSGICTFEDAQIRALLRQREEVGV